MTGHGRELLSLEEVREAARAFGLRRPIEAEPLGRGSRRSAKSRLTTPDGRFLLKRRASDPAVVARLGFVHALQAHLADAGCPVPRLRRSTDGRTAVTLAAGTYELFEWVDGARWAGRVPESAEVGASLGAMLDAAARFRAPADAPSRSFRGAVDAADVLDRVVGAAMAADPDTDRGRLSDAVASLLGRARRAAGRTRDAGIDSWPRQCIHGDLHPGNVLFSGGRLAALLDFDGARVDHRACEVANALVHFGNHSIAGRAHEDWRVELDARRMSALAGALGRALGSPLSEQERGAIPWLMIESCTLESIVPVAGSGRFVHLRADRFLPFIERKTAWIESAADSISSP